MTDELAEILYEKGLSGSDIKLGKDGYYYVVFNGKDLQLTKIENAK